MAMKLSDAEARPLIGASGLESARRRWWPARIAAWIAERHGPGVQLVVVLLFALSFSAGALELAAGDWPSHRSVALLPAVLGGVAFWSWFVMLRALDDLEDAAADATAHPGRMLARGAISRRDLWILVGAAGTIQGLVSIAFDAEGASWSTTATWLAMVAFLGFAAVEFALPAFWTQRAIVLRLLRMPASVLPLAWAYAMGAGSFQEAADLPVQRAALLLMAIGLATVATVDIARRYAPAPGGFSWQERLGTVPALLLLTALLALLGGLCFALTAAAHEVSGPFAPSTAWPAWTIAPLAMLVAAAAAVTARTGKPAAAVAAGLTLLLATTATMAGLV